MGGGAGTNGNPGTGRGRKTKKMKLKKSKVPEKQWEDLCFRCFDGGELLMCNFKTCPKVKHLNSGLSKAFALPSFYLLS